jgi:hypothetical protein
MDRINSPREEDGPQYVWLVGLSCNPFLVCMHEQE